MSGLLTAVFYITILAVVAFIVVLIMEHAKLPKIATRLVWAVWALVALWLLGTAVLGLNLN